MIKLASLFRLHKLNLFTFTAVLSLSLLHAESAGGYIADYTPVSPKDRKHVIRLESISEAVLKEGKELKVGCASLRLPETGNDLEIYGKTTDGRTWKISKQYYGLGTCILKQDLDKNGVEDIVLIQSTGACGIAPPAVLTTLLFDRKHQPFPMEVTGYFAANDHAWEAKEQYGTVEDLVRIGSDPRAVLICNQLDYAILGGRNRSFWRTILYRCEEGRWKRMNSYNSNSQPMLVRYTFKANKKVISTPVPALKRFDDIQFTRSHESTCKNASIDAAEFEQNGSLKCLTLSGRRFQDGERNFAFTYLIHSDAKKNIEMVCSNSDAFGSILKKAAEEHTRVKFFAPNENRLPLYIWQLDN